jgi:hypothetical protein
VSSVTGGAKRFVLHKLAWKVHELAAVKAVPYEQQYMWIYMWVTFAICVSIVSSSRSFPVQSPEPNRRRIARGNTNCIVIHLSTIKNSCFLVGPIVLMTWICIGATR